MCACQLPLRAVSLLGFAVLMGGVCIGLAIGALHMINVSPDAPIDAQKPQPQELNL
jgi:hypothetical protein